MSPAPILEKKRKRREGPRIPSRGRGVIRYSALLDAVESLLQSHDPDTVGLYQIAERAAVPPASVYHFFPTKEAAFVGLAERYAARLIELHRTPIEARLIEGWGDLFRVDTRRAMEFFNSNVPALKIYYGGYGGLEGRAVDRVTTAELAKSSYHRANRILHMPHLANPSRISAVRLNILDAIWTSSVQSHGRITEDYHEEALAACIAYTSLYLPRRVDRREVLIDAAKQDRAIILPYDEETVTVM